MSVLHTLIDIRKAIKAGQKAHAAYQAGIDALRKRYAGKTRDEVGEALRPHVGSLYSIALTDTGFDTDSDKYAAAKQFLYRVKNDIAPKASHKAEPVKLTRAQRAAAQAFLALFPSKTAAKAALDL